MNIFKNIFGKLLLVTTMQLFVMYTDCLPISNVPCDYRCGYSVYHNAGVCQPDGRCYCWWGWTGPNAKYESQTSNRIYADFCVNPCHYTHDYRNIECASDYINEVKNQTLFPEVANVTMIFTAIQTEPTAISSTIINIPAETTEVPTIIFTKTSTVDSKTTEAITLPKMSITNTLPFNKITDVLETAVEVITFATNTTTVTPVTTIGTPSLTTIRTTAYTTSTDASTTKQSYPKTNPVPALTLSAIETTTSVLPSLQITSTSNYLTTSNTNVVTTLAATTTEILPRILPTASEATTLSTTKASIKIETTTEYKPDTTPITLTENITTKQNYPKPNSESVSALTTNAVETLKTNAVTALSATTIETFSKISTNASEMTALSTTKASVKIETLTEYQPTTTLITFFENITTNLSSPKPNSESVPKLTTNAVEATTNAVEATTNALPILRTSTSTYHLYPLNTNAVTTLTATTTKILPKDLTTASAATTISTTKASVKIEKTIEYQPATTLITATESITTNLSSPKPNSESVPSLTTSAVVTATSALPSLKTNLGSSYLANSNTNAATTPADTITEKVTQIFTTKIKTTTESDPPIEIH